MPTISSPGIGSGLDIGGIVQQLVLAERAPMENRLNRREADLQAKISAYGNFKGALASFQDTFANLRTGADFQKTAVAISDEDVFSATTNGSVATGSYSIQVSDLAQSHKLASKAFAGTTDSIGTGDITFRFGTYDSGGNTFTANADKSIETITIDGTNNSLQGIRDAVNAADIGISASIVNDGTGYRLLFKSQETGVANSLEITVNDAGDGSHLDDSGLSQLAYDPTALGVGSGKNLSETTAAKDAIFSIDGLPMTRAANTVSGAIEGVTLELKRETAGVPASLTVAQDKEGISNALSSFVSGYNALVETLDDLAGYDSVAQQGGVLMGDSLVNNVTSQIRNVFSGVVSGLSGQYTALVQLGITTQLDGTLELDSSTLQEALDNDFEAVARVFAVTGSPSDSLVEFVGATSDTLVGDYAVDISRLATQGSYTGAAAAGFPLAVAGANDTFAIKIDGIQSETISLTQKSYASGAELAAEIQSQINADENVENAGSSVVVSFVTDHLEIISSRYGSASKVELTAVEGSGLGLAVGAGSDGEDVAGTIGGVAATGSGRVLRGTGDADGLQIEVTGGAMGARGSISFTRGVADQLDSLLGTYLGADNLIDMRSDGFNTSVAEIEDQREVLDARMLALEGRYLTQFTALDLLLSQMQVTSDFLSQQLEALPGAYQSRSK